MHGVYICVGLTRVTVHTWTSEDNRRAVDFDVDSEDQIQVLRLVYQVPLYCLKYLPSPKYVL